ncbi:MAG: rRNA maturation RNase YbeY [Verrucomicrobiales bacterium]|nr:rRNA maturation RNase YbeY [Verrucomicrobiales bacterium]
MPPSLEFYNHVEALSDQDCARLSQWSKLALPACLEHPGPGSCDLPELDEIEISIVSDETIGEIHDQFMDDPSPTDVITFQHGEIMISHDTAHNTAAGMEHSTLEELFLYVVHGLLHLNGHLDAEESDRKEMHRIQDEIWCQVLTAGE